VAADGREHDAAGGAEEALLGRWPHLGIPLRAARRELRISQPELAARAAISAATVGRPETGRLDVRCDLVLDVLQAAGPRLLLLGPDGTPLILSPDQVHVLLPRGSFWLFHRG